MIILENLSKTFSHDGREVHALRDVSLHVNKGEIYGVVGESGAGKSTLIRCVNLLERPTSGRVIIDGAELTAMNHAELLRTRQNIGMIFQHFNLLSSRTAAENIALPLELIGMRKAQIKEKVSRLLELTGLTDRAGQYPAQLSGGQKQRVAIARALASDPKVLLSDEATSALDPKTTESILALLKEINQKLGLTILLITHEMEVVKRICHRVALIDGGQLVENNTVEAFFTNPQSDLGRQFIAQSQKFELPEDYAASLRPSGDYPVVKLSFTGTSVDEPVLSALTRKFDVDVSIIQAKVENIGSITSGLLIAEIIGASDNIRQAMQWLGQLQITMEILGYAQSGNG